MVLDAKDLALQAAKVCSDKKAEDIEVLDLRDISSVTDYFVICSGGSMQQLRAIVKAVEEEFGQYDLAIKKREGNDDSRWILLDLGDVVVHVFHVEERDYYDLERLWRDAPKLDMPEDIAGTTIR